MPQSAAFRPLTVAPADIFTDNLAAHATQEQYHGRRHQAVAWVRVLIFVVGALGGYLLFSNGRNVAGLAFVLTLYVVFVLIMRWHSRLGYQYNHYRLLRIISQEELARLGGKLTQFEAGARYLDASHAYAADLDVFGPYSLFQLLSRATSRLGQDRLADWLRQAAAPATVQARQAAVAELAPDATWQQEWQARARHFPRQTDDPRRFAAWLQQPDFFADKAWLKAALFVLPPLALTSAGLWLSGYSFGVVVPFLVLLGGINHHYRAARDEYFEHSDSMYDVLRAYRDQLALLEEREVKSPPLVALRNLIAPPDGVPASRLIGQLAGIVAYFSVRQSTLAAFFANNLLFWDFFWMWRLEGWKRQLGGKLGPMLDVVAEVEALVSLAAYQFANPIYTVPELSNEALEFTAEGLGHPLIFATARITNDFSTVGAGHTGVVTGSNMSGKTTFLRTVGLNMVLALAGGAVCARHLRVSPAQVYTAMRTQDNLAESTSSFYAELKRLRLLLELTAQGTPVFYLLDEILKGTNSRDRHRGARALIHQLHQRPASGLISTHDLELGALADELPGAVTNYSFNSTIEGDEILFDYHLTPGLCRSFNASKLMQLMGIAIDNEE
ncbi:DNA mismatch repair protein MutS domain protein [Hymenobacter roseosalivarius DSM 11622]|uniref:DNA mismatch repair protein MutS domain protein n=1 Tax=Hymenobacter roseosalivarius DSM 11622 TaxID=645990 RepID=A0A1W1VT47_9BACT|nr:DNA mismatch repair protein MutS [Hymenobacter roseosalivarius]SMB96542.1 DNA mismatch repair protein MutS domain protein [Hymenobacter roseosalivarius DSM 11622]